MKYEVEDEGHSDSMDSDLTVGSAWRGGMGIGSGDDLRNTRLSSSYGTMTAGVRG